MSEYSKERKYFLKLPRDFFEKYYVRILLGLPDGDRYLTMYLKLMCESISHEGYLRYSKATAYTPKMLASVIQMDPKVVEEGLKALEGLEMVERTEEGSLFLPLVPEMVTSSTKGSEEAAARRRTADKRVTKGLQKGDICQPELEYRIKSKNEESELELEKDKKKKKINEKKETEGDDISNEEIEMMMATL